MKDPVEGSAEVVSASAHSGRGLKEICELQLVVEADGVEPTAVEHNQIVHRDRWPEEGMALPVVVDRANPKSLVIKFDDVPTVTERGRAAAEARAAEKRREQQR